METPQTVHVLLIVKDLHDASRLKKILADTNTYSYQVEHADSLHTGLDLLNRFTPDIVLLEFYLWGSYGFDAFLKVKKIAPSVPLIVLNGVDDKSLAQEIIRLGAHDYLVKGQESDIQLLSRIMRYVVAHKQTHGALEHRFEFEKLIATISTQFISLTIDKIENGIEEALGKIGKFIDVDRGYIFWYSDKLGRHMERIHEWCATGVESQLQRIRELNMDMFPYFDQTIKDLEPFYAPRLADLPSTAKAEREEFASQGVQSLIFLPLIYAGTAIGFMGFESVRCEKAWPEEIVALMKLVSEIFINALERKRADKILRESEERYALAARGVNDGLWDWNIKTNKIYFSLRWKTMLGYTDHEIGDEPDEWFRRVHPNDIEQVNAKISLHLEGISDHYEIEHRMQHKDGTYRWMLSRGIAIRDDRERVQRMAGSQTDITEQKKTEEQLLHNALHDSLTGLASRALFLNRLEHAIERTKFHDNFTFTVLFVDLDRFKAINDSFGHLMGDQLLKDVAQRIESRVCSTDTVARFGGDEFTLLLEDIQDINSACHVAERVLDALRRPFQLNGHTIFMTASIGIALSSTDNVSSEELLRNADTAMYRAKAMKRGHYVIYNEDLHAKDIELLRLETDLRQAAENKDFILHYQPIMSLQSGELTGFEALIRWQHPERGLISPEIFIPLAEESGLIIPIGLWVLREACLQMAHWKKIYPLKKLLTLSVNLSMKQFMQPDLVEQIQMILQETGLDANTLSLEITESVFVENTEMAVNTFTQLRALDIQLHLDDFGTGYSSLSYLHRFQVNALKIDRSFIRNIGTAGENSEIIQTIVSLARNLGMEVVAEGVETAGQLSMLRMMGCEYGQGFLFSKPLDRENASELMKQSNLS